MKCSSRHLSDSGALLTHSAGIGNYKHAVSSIDVDFEDDIYILFLVHESYVE